MLNKYPAKINFLNLLQSNKKILILKVTNLKEDAMKLSIKAFGLTCGILWGLAVLLSTYWIVISESGGATMGLLGKFYIGYSVTWIGGLIGLVWGFVDGLICGAIFAWLYNRLAAKKE